MESSTSLSSGFAKASSRTAEFLGFLRHGFTRQSSVYSSSSRFSSLNVSRGQSQATLEGSAPRAGSIRTDLYERVQRTKVPSEAYFHLDKRKKSSTLSVEEAKRSHGRSNKSVQNHLATLCDFFEYLGPSHSGEKFPLPCPPKAKVNSCDTNDLDEGLRFMLEGKEWYLRSGYYARLKQRREEAVESMDRVRILKDPVTGRQKWGSNGVFILVCVCVAMANAGTGPMSAYISKEGAGVSCIALFLILAIVSALLTIPLIVLELALGQVVQGSQVKVYDTLLHRARGIGLAGCLMAVFQGIAECLFGATAIIYLVSSLSRDLPWDATKQYIEVCEDPTYNSKEKCEAVKVCMWTSSKCAIDPLAKPLEFFNEVWQVNPETGMSNSILWANSFLWLVVCLMLVLGIHVVANIAPFVAVLPNIWFMVVTFVLWLNNAGGHLASGYLYSGKYDNWDFIRNISLTSVVQMNEVSMRTLPSAGMGVLLTLASYNNLSGNVHVAAWAIFFCIWLLIFAAFHFLYGNAGELMYAYGIKEVPEGTDMINWMIGKIRRIILSNPLVPGYYVFADPSFSTMPLTFPSIPAKNVWCMLYYLWAVCALIMYTWAKTLPFLTVMIDSRALYNKAMKEDNGILNRPIDYVEKMENNCFDKAVAPTENLLGKEATVLDSRNAEREAKEDCEVIGRFSRTHPDIHVNPPVVQQSAGCVKSPVKERGGGMKSRHRLPRLVIASMICIPIYLLSFVCIQSSSNSVYETAQYLVNIGTDIAHSVYACFAVLAAWTEGMQAQKDRVGCFPVSLLAVCWLFSGLLMGFLQMSDIRHSIWVSVFCLIVGGTPLALLLCRNSVVIKRYDVRILEGCGDSQPFCNGIEETGTTGEGLKPAGMIVQRLSLSDRAWWLFLGNIELLRTDLNTAINADAHRPIPFYWSVLLKFWATPMLVATATWRIVASLTAMTAHFKAHGDTNFIGPVTIMTWTLTRVYGNRAYTRNA